MRDVLRPVLPRLSDEIIAAIAQEVPGYRRAMEGNFGAVVRLGVETALGRFVEGAEVGAARETYVNLGRGEFHAGRTLDALLAAYRLGARLAWRRFVEAGVRARRDPDELYDLGEAIFAYIDELSAASAEGYADEQTRSAGEAERRRRALVRALAEDAPAELVRTAATDAGWELPRRLAALVVADGRPADQLDTDARGLAGRLGGGAIGAEADGVAVVWIPDAQAPGRGQQIEAALSDRDGPGVLGPELPWREAGTSLRRAVAARAVIEASAGLHLAADQLPALLLGAEPALATELVATRLSPLESVTGVARVRLTETLRAWLDRPGQVQAVAADLGVHPQTVRYRVRRLRELFGTQMEDPEARFELGMALRISAGRARE